jgi:hypothetical protein
MAFGISMSTLIVHCDNKATSGTLDEYNLNETCFIGWTVAAVWRNEFFRRESPRCSCAVRATTASGLDWLTSSVA